MAVQRLLDMLKHNHTEYSIIKHEVAGNAFSSALTAHVPGNKMVKSLLLKLDNHYTMVVLPSTSTIDFKKLKEVTGTHLAELAREDDLENIFPDCSTGAIPPLGNLYHMPVITDNLICKSEDMFFEAGSHREIIKMHYSDYVKLTHPKIVSIHK